MYYVIQVQTGKEDKTIEDIKRYKKHELDFDIFSPCRKELRKYKGELKDVKVKCFPGYLFVETEDIKQLFKDLYWIQGFTKILGREAGSDNFLPLSKEESRVIDILYSEESGRVTEISDIVLTEGDKIRVVAGPLMGQESIIKKVNLHKRTVTIDISLAGRGMEVKVGINIVTKANI